MTDIVERLRLVPAVSYADCREAADDIERLRADVLGKAALAMTYQIEINELVDKLETLPGSTAPDASAARE
jgi:hypothetical protein